MGNGTDKKRKAELAKWLVKMDPETAKYFKDNEEWWEEQEKKDPTNKKLKAEADRNREGNLVMAKERAKLEAAEKEKAKAPPAAPVGKGRPDTKTPQRTGPQNMVIEEATDLAPSGAPTGSVKRQGPVLTSITISYDKSPIVVGKQYQFTARGDFSDKTNRPLKGVVWGPSKSKVVSIDKNTGLALITDVGSETITAEDPSGTAPPGTFLLKTEGIRSKETPNGTITYYADQEEWLMPKLEKALKAYQETEALDLKANEEIIEMVEVQKSLKSQDEILKEISDKATEGAKTQSKISQLAVQDTLILKGMLETFQRELEEAKANLLLDKKDLEKVEKQDRAAALRKKGEELDKSINFAIKTVANTLGIAAALASSTVNPWSIAKVGVDQIGELVKLFGSVDFFAEARALEAEAKAIELDNAAARYRNAGIHLKQVADEVGKAQALAKKVQETYDQFRQEAENKFDDTTQGGFQFKNLIKAIEVAERAYKHAKQNQEVAYSSMQAAKALSIMDKLPPDGWKPANRPEAERILRIMYGDSNRMFEGANDIVRDAGAARKRLQATYAAAHEALVKSKGTGAPRSGK